MCVGLFLCGQDRFLWIFGDTLISKGADAGSWDRKGGVHAFPRQTLGTPHPFPCIHT